MYVIIIAIRRVFMERIKNKEYLEREIMEQSRHQFIYGYNTADRKVFLETMESHYPIVLDKDSPMGIYISEYGLPNISPCNKNLERYKIDQISSEFLYFSIIYDILLKSKKQHDITLLNDRLRKLIETLNKYSINKDYSQILDLDDLIKVLRQSKEFYRNYFIEYLSKGTESLSINDVALPFMQFDLFVRQLKRALNNESYFGIIIDKQSDISVSSTRAINFLVGGRINRDISMKIVTEPDKWDSYRDSNGQFIESVHDYGVVELDDSNLEHLKILKKTI